MKKQAGPSFWENNPDEFEIIEIISRPPELFLKDGNSREPPEKYKKVNIMLFFSKIPSVLFKIFLIFIEEWFAF